MKKITLLVIMIVTAFTLNAQSLVKYHGEINAGYSVGIGTFATNRVNIHTIQGVDISKYFSTGVGIGLDYYHELYEKGELVLPLFLNMKGYLPATETVSPFFRFRCRDRINKRSRWNGWVYLYAFRWS